MSLLTLLGVPVRMASGAGSLRLSVAETMTLAEIMTTASSDLLNSLWQAVGPVLLLALLAALLFGVAGTLAWRGAWLYLALAV